jgi:hypothetical protein
LAPATLAAVAGGRMAAIVALIGVTLAATASAGSTSPPVYTVAATDACLKGLPDAVIGLPPATPPVPPVPFVYRFPADRVRSPAQAQLGAWYGHKNRGAYDGVTLSFFKTVHDARSFDNSSLSRGSVISNVVVGWDDYHHPPVVEESWRKAVRGCLRAVPTTGAPGSKRPTPRASLATFAGLWVGHTRRLGISSGGRGIEDADDGCCDPQYLLRFQILSVSGTLTRATALYRVTSFKRHHQHIARLRPGQIGRLLLKNGIVTNTLTQDSFCSDPASGATGCGA